MARFFDLEHVRRRVPATFLAAVLAASLLYLAVPRAIAAFVMLPGNQALRVLQDRKTTDRTKLESIVASRRQALAWQLSGRTWSDIGLAQLLLAVPDEHAGSVNAERLREASSALAAALALGPANPNAWTRLAYADLLSSGPSPSVASALIMAVLTARYDPDLMFVRLELCLGVWRYFARADRDLVLDQVRLAWRNSPRRLAEISEQTGRRDIVRAALATTPGALAEFERLVRNSNP